MEAEKKSYLQLPFEHVDVTAQKHVPQLFEGCSAPWRQADHDGRQTQQAHTEHATLLLASPSRHV